MLLVVYLQVKRAESWVELERLFPSTLLSGHSKTQIDPRAVCKLRVAPPRVGRAGRDVTLDCDDQGEDVESEVKQLGHR